MRVRSRKFKFQSWLIVLAAVILVCLLNGSAFAANVPADFETANKLYEQGKFADAAAGYEKLIQSGVASPALYFNLGNAEFKAGEIGRALAAYQRAEQLAPRDAELRANLRFVRNQVQGPTLAPSRWKQWLGFFTVNEWAIASAALLWLWLIWLAARELRPALKKSASGFVWLGGVAAVLLCSLLGLAYVNATAKTAIVVAREAVAHNGPLDESPAAFTAHDGAELKVLDTKNDWLQVSPDDRHIGWLKRDEVMLATLH